MSEISIEAIFSKNAIKSICIDLEFPIDIQVDNTGAIYIENNHAVGQHTKHIDIRTHFVQKFIKNNIIEVLFVK